MHPWLLLWMTVDSFSSYRTSCYGSTTLFLLLSNNFFGQQCNRYTGIHILNVTTTTMIANNVKQTQFKRITQIRAQKPTSLPPLSATCHVSLHDRPHHFMKKKAVNLCVQHANQREKSCLQPKYLSQQQTFGGSEISREQSQTTC